MRLLLFVTIICLCFSTSFAACGFYPLTLQQTINESSQIVEGKITNKVAYYNSAKTFIYTKYTIKISKIFKGKSVEYIDFVEEGGSVGNEIIQTTAQTNINVNDEGVFFLHEKSVQNFELATAFQSFFKYDYSRNISTNSVLNFSIIDNAFCNLLQNTIGQNALFISKFKTQNVIPNRAIQSAPFINSISPTSITAGTSSILTINGSGFGDAQNGFVFFANPDDGGQTYISAPSSFITSFNDTKITVKVPSQAGTGKVWVRKGTETGISTQKLTVNYSRSNVVDNNNYFTSNLVDANETGGYLLSLNKKFEANMEASSSFIDALENWRCATFVNFATTQSADLDVRERDNTNIVRFAKQGELKPGILGITYSYYAGCNSDNWFLKEFDMVFLDTTIWNFNNATATNLQYDFNTVVLHELGHAHQLSHVIDTGNIMHYSVKKANEKRVIDENSLSCANLLISDSKKTILCGPSNMQLLNNEVCGDASFTYYELKKPILTPNPANNLLTIDFFLPQKTNVLLQLFNVDGKLIAELLNAEKPAGKVSVAINLHETNFSNGLYFVKFIAQNKSFVSKLILNK